MSFCVNLPCFVTAPAENLQCFPSPALALSRDIDDTEEQPIEINYDSPAELTYLYQAIEDKAFFAAIEFLESNKPEVYDECRTWVTRYEKENPKKIRWSQLPLHAAIVFKAPHRLIELLIKRYPKAVRCTDDQSMLPIHLAFRYGHTDPCLHALLTEFPESINAKDTRGRTPLQLASQGPSKLKGEIISMFETNAKSRAMKKREEVGVMEGKLSTATAMNAELQNKNEALEGENKVLKEKLAELESEMETLRTEKVVAAPSSDQTDDQKTRSPLARVLSNSKLFSTGGGAVATAAVVGTGAAVASTTATETEMTATDVKEESAATSATNAKNSAKSTTSRKKTKANRQKPLFMRMFTKRSKSAPPSNVKTETTDVTNTEAKEEDKQPTPTSSDVGSEEKQQTVTVTHSVAGE